MHRTIRTAATLGVALFAIHLTASAALITHKKAAPSHSTRLIIKFREPLGKPKVASGTARRMQALALQGGTGMQVVRAMSGGAHVVRVDRPMASGELMALASKLSRQRGVEYAEPDARRYPMLAPNDARYADQHYLMGPALEAAAINAPAAWDVTTGSAATVVAVIDTGIRPEHIDIAGRRVAGYDFVRGDPGGGFFTANDGNGRDANPADPGDGVATNACGLNSPPQDKDSVWHGTRVTSLIGAVTNDGQGMAGIDWNARMLPVRALGRCGGYSSDVVDAVRWAAGLPVPGVPNNPHPARIINLSLGGPGTCLASEQAAIDDVVAAGVLVVAAAGNEATNALRSSPANCRGVLPLAAATRASGLAPFSNFGPKVGLIGPGTDLLTAANRGTQGPIRNGDTHDGKDGTSFSAPLAAGVAALMLGLNPDLTPRQLIATLRANARAFPPVTGLETRCSERLCGAGLLDAAAAVAAVAANRVAPGTDGGNGLQAAFAAAPTLQPGGSRAGALAEPFQFDVYRIALPAARVLRLATTGGTDTYGYLFDARGKLLQQHDDIDPPTGEVDQGPFNLNFSLEAELPAGTYYLAVEGFNRNTVGAYRLSADASTPNSAGGGGGASLGLLSIVVSAWLFNAVRQRRGRPPASP